MNRCDRCNKELKYNLFVNGWICSNPKCKRYHPIRQEANRGRNQYIMVDRKDVVIVKDLDTVLIHKRAFD